MKDLTKGPGGGHVLQLAGFIALTTTFQTLYFLADLYFVGRVPSRGSAGRRVDVGPGPWRPRIRGSGGLGRDVGAEAPAECAQVLREFDRG